MMNRLQAGSNVGLVRRLRSRSGGAALELAVVMPVLILIAIGVMDYGRVFFTSVAVSNAARAGAEWGAQGNAEAMQQANIENFAKLDGAEASPITVTSQTICRCGATTVGCTSTCSGGYGAPRVFVEVTASKSVTLLLPYPGLPSSISISRTATFRAQ